MFADFLMKILKWYPSDRPTAQEMLEHPWLTMEEDYNYKMSEIEFKIYELRDQATQVDNFDPEVNYIMDYKANLMNQNNQHHV
jgi:serine/threonine protein kinase